MNGKDFAAMLRDFGVIKPSTPTAEPAPKVPCGCDLESKQWTDDARLRLATHVEDSIAWVAPDGSEWTRDPEPEVSPREQKLNALAGTYADPLDWDSLEEEGWMVLAREKREDWAAEREDVLARFQHELAKATGDGSKKRQAGAKPPWYEDDSHERAVFSHITKWKAGETADDSSGAFPTVHSAWRLLALACIATGNYPGGPNDMFA